MRLAPNLVNATNTVREAMDENTPFLKKISIFQKEINNQITSIENSKDKYLKSKKLKFLERHPFLKSNNEHLFKKLQLSEQRLSEALALVYEQQAGTVPSDIFTILNETQTALTACKDSLSTISGYESKSMSDKKFALGAVIVNFVSGAVVPCIVQALAAKGVIPASIAAASLLGVSAALAAPVVTAIVGAVIGVATLIAGVCLYCYYKNRSADPSHKLDNTKLALEELSSCLTVMQESLGISELSALSDPQAIDTPRSVSTLNEALNDKNIAVLMDLLTSLINNRDAIRALDDAHDVVETPTVHAPSTGRHANVNAALIALRRTRATTLSAAGNRAALMNERRPYSKNIVELTHL